MNTIKKKRNIKFSKNLKSSQKLNPAMMKSVKGGFTVVEDLVMF